MSVPLFELELVAGSDFEWSNIFADQAGDLITGTDGWSAACTVRAEYGTEPLLEFTAEGTASAEFVGDDTELLVLTAPAAVTATLPATIRSDGTPARPFVADLVFTRADPAERVHVCDFVVTIAREATAS